ncbi:MAG: hypothetical protein COA96_14090 [SAR86 cluster bacterium]|uniref:Uncharacterized protein n=1 Tax=SAR86 cluster bacterium TaxID=2030880 RepID=A0A2A5AUH4_9GAMM|nr:MAG: hypothetical protein COA96_14090 [SAR86 cluster bacterium]
MLFEITVAVLILLLAMYLYTAWTYRMVERRLDDLAIACAEIANNETLADVDRKVTAGFYLAAINPWWVLSIMPIIFGILFSSSSKTETTTKFAQSEYPHILSLMFKQAIPINLVSNPLLYLVLSPFLILLLIAIAVRQRFGMLNLSSLLGHSNHGHA